jgi:hypothetical protein
MNEQHHRAAASQRRLEKPRSPRLWLNRLLFPVFGHDIVVVILREWLSADLAGSHTKYIRGKCHAAIVTSDMVIWAQDKNIACNITATISEPLSAWHYLLGLNATVHPAAGERSPFQKRTLEDLAAMVCSSVRSWCFQVV